LCSMKRNRHRNMRTRWPSVIRLSRQIVKH
jgi:hypothetical protein